MAGFPLTRLLNRKIIAEWLREHEAIKAFENAQRDILELFKRIFPDAPSDGTTYGRRDGEWTQVAEGAEVDLGYARAPTQGTVTNSAGDDAVLPSFTRDDAGLVPAPITATASRFLRDDGTWQTVAAGESKVFTGLQTHLYAVMQPYGSQLQYSTGAPGMTSTTGTIFTPTRSTTNPVQAINRECRYASNAAPATVGWITGTSTAIPSSVEFPAAAGQGGFRFAIIGGLDSDVSNLVNTSFGFGLAYSAALLPAPGAALNSSAPGWFGIYSLEGSTDILYGYKLPGSTTVVSLGSFPLTWATFRGMRAVIEFNPIDLSTSYDFQLLTAIGTFQSQASGRTTAFQPGAVPFSPWFYAYKNESTNYLRLWCSGWSIINYPYGSASR